MHADDTPTAPLLWVTAASYYMQTALIAVEHTRVDIALQSVMRLGMSPDTKQDRRPTAHLAALHQDVLWLNVAKEDATIVNLRRRLQRRCPLLTNRHMASCRWKGAAPVVRKQ